MRQSVKGNVFETSVTKEAYLAGRNCFVSWYVLSHIVAAQKTRKRRQNDCASSIGCELRQLTLREVRMYKLPRVVKNHSIISEVV